MPSPIRVLGLDQVVLKVADMTRSVAFYRDVLGLSVEREVKSIGLVQMRAGRHLIDLLPGNPSSDPSDHTMDHLCLRIETFDLDALRRHLESHGVKTGESGRRYGAEGDGPSLYLSDPDGHGLELKGPPDPL